MTAVLAPFGFQPDNHISAYGTRGETAYPAGIVSGYTSDIYKGQPVLMATTGVIQPVTANNVDFLGVFAGVEYTDSDGKRRVSDKWLANTVATDIVAYVWDDPGVIFEVQGDGSYAQTAVGDQVNITNFSNQIGTTGLSAATTGTVVGAGVQGQWRVIGLSTRVDNAWGDAYTIIRVMNARHQYVAVKVAI